MCRLPPGAQRDSLAAGRFCTVYLHPGAQQGPSVASWIRSTCPSYPGVQSNPLVM
jgi:hypothetical protein